MKTIAVVGGGNSGESVISLKSTETVLNTISKKKYHVYKVIIIGKKWNLHFEGKEYAIDKNDFSAIIDNKKIIFDCVFNVIHGTPGEDGKLQGYFDLIGMPYTSCNLLTSAITFNKEICKKLLGNVGVKTAKSVVLNKQEPYSTDAIISVTGVPCFVKPNNGGSSIGASKVSEIHQLNGAIEKAFSVDDEILIEEYLTGTEMTCGVAMIDGKPTSLGITEIVSTNDFFDFEAKYENKETREITPARISDAIAKECRSTSEFIYKILECKGMIRVDYMLHKDNLYMVEVNTIPGLTDRSLIPQQATYYGISIQDLFHEAIEQALN